MDNNAMQFLLRRMADEVETGVLDCQTCAEQLRALGAMAVEEQTTQPKEEKPLCLRCRKCGIDRDFRQLRCREERPEFATEGDGAASCEGFVSRYIEFPIQVDGIQLDGEPITLRAGSVGRLVKVRPCGDDGGGKTFLGFFLGELAISPSVSFDLKTKVMRVSTVGNPAIFVPDLVRIVWGAESFWSLIDTEEDLRDITDETINEQWYMKALRRLQGKP